MNSILTSKNRGLYLGVLIFCTLCFTAVLLPKDSFLFLVQEDGPFECAGAILFFLSSVLFFLLYLNGRRFKSETDRARFSSLGRRTWFLLLALLFLFLTGEEISWGQRIFGWATPEGYAKRNMQDETNLHNLDLFHLQKTRPGTEEHIQKTGIAALLTAKKIFVYIFVSFLFLLPLANRYVPFVRNLVRKLYIPVPAIELGILFILNILIYRAFKPLATGYRGVGRGLGEVEEFNFALILFLVPLLWFGFESIRSNSSNKLKPIYSDRLSGRESK